MPAPKEIIELVERFERNLEEYKSGRYNETQLRIEFLDPFFEALGWDINNKEGRAPAYRDVTHEDRLSVGEWTKSPDYCFRVGKERKFFLEAKKPSVNISEDISPAYQLRRYAWSAKLPLSILSDFEEFAVYDTRIKPVKTNGAKVARIMCLTYKDYIEKWDEIAGIFSREAVLKGSFDKYAVSGKKRRGTAEVDDEFLKEIESWREILAKNIADNNPKLSTRELNYAVQSTIDRIIFLRICEDRRIEDYARLMALQNGDNIYPRLCDLFKQADEKYNSGLFHFSEEKGRTGHPDTLALKLKIDDKPIKEIIKGLYYPDSPYQFDYMPIEILGQVYEQFLGKVIRLEDHHAIIEEKPEVRKAGGVYYTPKYIVDYIVKNTVGKLLEGKTPKQAAKIKILDPACGSGSFLIGAYQYLLDWHREWYEKDGALKWAKKTSPVLYQDTHGGWQLTIAEKKRILLNNIFGVDIDSQAVEVTKLSLLLKVLEGETSQTINSTLRLFHERALPDLGNNIKCGNSLIGPDFYDNRQTSFLNEEEKYRINVFDWKTEFKEIMDGSGFDAVIGNPPWGADFSEAEQGYLRIHYQLARGSNIDSYAVFIECSLMRLKHGGLLGYITPDTFLRKDDHILTRKLLLENTHIIEIIETGPVFSKVRDTWCLVSTIANDKPSPKSKIRHKKINRFVVSTEERLGKFGHAEWDSDTEVLQSVWRSKSKMVIGYLATEQEQLLIDKIEKHLRLGQLQDKYRISRGEEGSKFSLKSAKGGRFFTVIPQDVERYNVAEGLRVDESMFTSNKVESLYSHPKIWIVRIQKMRWKQRIVCAFDDRINSAGMKTLQIVVSPSDNAGDLKYLLGILASRLGNFWCVNYLADDMNQSYLEKVPISTINSIDSANKSLYRSMLSLVEQMHVLQTKFATAKADHDKTSLQRQIEATDNQIDQLVYKLYGLTEEEIGVVEGVE